MGRKFLQVIIEVPEGCPVEDAKKYIREELAAAGGQLRPDDPLFEGIKVIGEIRSIRPGGTSMIIVEFLHPLARPDHVGLIPYWLNEDDPTSARDQFDRNYRHGGGWHPFKGFTLKSDNSISYPGDPNYIPIAQIKFRDELICIYDHAWVAIIQPDRAYEICRMD